jgi:hypothetical protein
MKKYVVVNLGNAGNLHSSRTEADAEAKHKTAALTKDGARNSYGIFELVAETVVPTPDIEVREIK